jgi:hypothetical protein
MTAEAMETLLPRLAVRLGQTNEEDTALLTALLEEAEETLILYLNVTSLPEQLWGKLVELAALYAQRQKAEQGAVKAVSYSEGEMSQSETYLTPAELQAAEAALLSALAPHRRRARPWD